MAFGWLKKAGKTLLQVAPVAAAIADLSGIPYAGRIGTIIQRAQDRGGTGAERGEFAFTLAMEEIPDILTDLEKRLGKKVPATVAAEYVRAQIQAHYDLLKALDALKPKP